MTYTRIEATTGKDKAALLRAVNLTANSQQLHIHITDNGAVQWFSIGARGQIGHEIMMQCQVSLKQVIVDVLTGTFVGNTFTNHYAGYPVPPEGAE